MEESSTRAKRSTKKRDAYSPTSFDFQSQRQPRRSSNTRKKPDKSDSPAPSLAVLPSSSAVNVNRRSLPSSSENNGRKATPKSSTVKSSRSSLLKLPQVPKQEIFIEKEPEPIKPEPSQSSLQSSSGNKSRKSIPKASSAKGSRSLLKLSTVPKDILVKNEPAPAEDEPMDVTPPPAEETTQPPAEKEHVFVAPLPPPPPPSVHVPFDFDNPSANVLPDRRNKSKSIFEIAPFLVKREESSTRPPRPTKKRDAYSPTSFDSQSQRQPRNSSNAKKKPDQSDSPEQFAILPSSSAAGMIQSSLPSSSKNKSRKSNPKSSSSKGPRSSSIKLPPLPPLPPLPEGILIKKESKSKTGAKRSSVPSSSGNKGKKSTPKSSVKSSRSLVLKLPRVPQEAIVQKEATPVEDEPMDVSPPPSEDTNLLPAEENKPLLAVETQPPQPEEEPVFVAPLPLPQLPPPPPPEHVPFDFENPSANVLPDRRNKSRSVYEIAPLLVKHGAPRRPRKPSIKKLSVSETEKPAGDIPDVAASENIGNDTVEGAVGVTNLLNAESQKSISLNPSASNVVGNRKVVGVEQKKKRKRKRPLRLTMKKKKVSKTSMPLEAYEGEVEEAADENVDFDDEGSEDEVIIECELESYGESSKLYLSNLHPDVLASFQSYEEEDGSYFTRFVLYGNPVKEDDTGSEEMVVDKTEYPPYMTVFLKGASGIVELCENRLKQTCAIDIFPTERMNIHLAIKILQTQFNKENLCEVLIYGLTEIHKIVLQTSTHKLPLPQMYIKCRDIATLIAHSLISYPTKLLFIFHQLFLTHLDVDALIVYMVLCRFVNQVFKISNILKEFSAPHLDEINKFFVETIKQNIVDPFREMVYKIDREFISKDVVVVALVCNDIKSDQYLDFQKMMLWFNTGFRKMGAIVESLTLSADWNNPELIQISAFNAIAMVQSYFKFIIQTYPNSKLVVVNYGDPSMFFYHAIHYTDRISGVINIAFSTSSVVDEVEHVRGGVEDTILNMAYCPSLFVIGEKAENSDISHYDQILRHYKSEQAGLIIVGDADDTLTVSSKTLLQYKITPACIKRILLEHFADFIEKCIAQPIAPRTYFPTESHSNDPDFEIYTATKEEITAMHMKLFEQTKNYYDIRADLNRKVNKNKDDLVISPNGETKKDVEEAVQSTEAENSINKFSQALVKLKFS